MTVQDIDASPGGAKRFIVPVLLALALIGLGWFIHSQMGSGGAGPKRQTVKIAVLPDTPPPPPPPKEEKRPEPKPEENKPQPQEQKVVEAPPEAQQLKMEGAAGDGPSAFQAGAVTQDYRGGPPQIGGAAASASAGLGDRAAERLYAGTVRQLLRDEMERQLSAEAGELSAGFALWISGDGRITRWELDGPADDTRRDGALRIALDRSADQLRLPSPPAVAQPLRFRLTVRAGG